MKALIRLFAIAFFISFSLTALSCSKDNYRHNYKSKRLSASTSTMAVVTKKKPVKKNFIIPKKKKRILGQQTPKTY